MLPVANVTEDTFFQGDGWLELRKYVMGNQDGKEVIGFEISTNKTHGIIMWYGDYSNHKNSNAYIVLAVIDG